MTTQTNKKYYNMDKINRPILCFRKHEILEGYNQTASSWSAVPLTSEPIWVGPTCYSSPPLNGLFTSSVPQDFWTNRLTTSQIASAIYALVLRCYCLV